MPDEIPPYIANDLGRMNTPPGPSGLACAGTVGVVGVTHATGRRANAPRGPDNTVIVGMRVVARRLLIESPREPPSEPPYDPPKILSRALPPALPPGLGVGSIQAQNLQYPSGPIRGQG